MVITQPPQWLQLTGAAFSSVRSGIRQVLLGDWVYNLAPEHMGTSLRISRNTLEEGCGMMWGARGLCEQQNKNRQFGVT